MKQIKPTFNSTKKLTHHIQKVMNHYNLRAFKLCVAMVLLNDKPLTVSTLAKLLGCSNANITGLRKTLESRGLIISERPATDNRKVYLSLTSKGEQFLKHYYGSDILTNTEQQPSAAASVLEETNNQV